MTAAIIMPGNNVTCPEAWDPTHLCADHGEATTRCLDCFHAGCSADCECRCHRAPVDSSARCSLCAWPPTAPCEGCEARLCVNHFGAGNRCRQCEWMSE